MCGMQWKDNMNAVILPLSFSVCLTEEFASIFFSVWIHAIIWFSRKILWCDCVVIECKEIQLWHDRRSFVPFFCAIGFMCYHTTAKKSIWLNRQTFHYQFVNWNLWFQQWWWRWWKTRQDGVASHDSNSHKWWILWQLKRIDAIHTIHPINIFTINFIFAYNSQTPTRSLTQTRLVKIFFNHMHTCAHNVNMRWCY